MLLLIGVSSFSQSFDEFLPAQAYNMQQHTGQPQHSQQQNQQQQPQMPQPQGQWQHLSQQQRPMQLTSFDSNSSDGQTNGQ